jgi:hypothetical protein
MNEFPDSPNDDEVDEENLEVNEGDELTAGYNIPESRKYQGIPLEQAERSAEELTEMLGWGLWEIGVFSGDGGLSYHVYIRPGGADIQATFIPPYTEDE